MIIAQQKKKENIAEYVLYMWQVEDMIRANQFDLVKIEENIIQHVKQPSHVVAQAKEWYAGLIDMMTTENVKESGHLQININTVLDLTDLHTRLMGNPEHLKYQQLFARVFPLLDEFRQKSKHKTVGDIELAFIGLYSFWMLKLQKRSVSEETQAAMNSFSELLSSLAQLYHRRERGELQI